MSKTSVWPRAMSARHALNVAMCVASSLVGLDAHAQMTVPGAFDVSPGGAASYSVPIQLPPGVGGLDPKLALVYNSQAGNGLLGVGWSLAGLSSISRCPKTIPQDDARGVVGYDTNDRYCLDGQRLIAISGADGGNLTEYRTEQDGIAKIVSYSEDGATGGPWNTAKQPTRGLRRKAKRQWPCGQLTRSVISVETITQFPTMKIMRWAHPIP